MIRTLERIIEGQGNVPQGAKALGLVHSNKIITKKNESWNRRNVRCSPWAVYSSVKMRAKKKKGGPTSRAIGR